MESLRVQYDWSLERYKWGAEGDERDQMGRK